MAIFGIVMTNMKRFLNIFHREINGIHQAAYLLGFFALLSQILALFRDRLLAASFGASQTLDIYYAAFRLPDLIFVSVASMVSISVLIPFMMDRLEENKEETKRFVNAISTAFGLVMIATITVAYFVIPHVTGYLFPGITDPLKEALLIKLARLLLLSPLFLGISNLLASITQLYKRFFLYALSPVLYNASIIFGIVFLYPHFGVTGVVYGVIIGAFLHFAIQIPFIFSTGLLPRPVLNFKWSEIKEVFLISIPRTFTLSANNIALIFVTAFASEMFAGSISVFNFSLNLQSVPLSIIGVSYSMAAFPTLAKLFSEGNRERFVEQVVVAARHIVFLSMPVIALFIVLRAQIVRTILGSGHFNWSDTRLTAACLALFSFSLVAQSLNLLFVRAYYAGGNTKKPLYVNLATTIGDIGFPFLLIILFNHSQFFQYFIESLFKVDGVPGSIVLMLPLGYSIGELANLIVFWWFFEKDFGGFSRPLFRTIRQSFSASVIMGFTAYSFLPFFASIFDINTVLGVFLQGFLSGLMGIAMGVFIFIVLKNREFIESYKALHSRVWKTSNIIVAEQEDLLR